MEGRERTAVLESGNVAVLAVMVLVVRGEDGGGCGFN